MSRRVPLKESEKRARVLELMWEKKCVFNLKELESQCDKEKGITPQSVKELVGVLVADGLIDSDKIGSGMFFWSLPSKVEKAKLTQRDKLKAEIAALHNEASAVQAQVKAARTARQPTKERKMKLEQLNQLKAKRKLIDTDLEKFAACDPDLIKKLSQLHFHHSSFPFHYASYC